MHVTLSLSKGRSLSCILGDIQMEKTKKSSKGRISAQALREFTENRRIANNAVKKAIEENKKYGIPEEVQFAR